MLKLQLDAASTALADVILTVPFDGTIVSNELIVGELVSPVVNSVMIGNLKEWQVESTDLTELDIVKIDVGDTVIVTFDALPDVEILGKVEKVRAFWGKLAW